MTAAIRSYPEYQRRKVANNRVARGERTGIKGLGYWAAVDALAKLSSEADEGDKRSHPLSGERGDQQPSLQKSVYLVV